MSELQPLLLFGVLERSMYYLFNSDDRTVSNQGNTNDVASITRCKLFACVRPFLFV